MKQFIGKNPNALEIGIIHGGSIEMWNYYFDNKCYIYGIDFEDKTEIINEWIENMKKDNSSKWESAHLHDVLKKYKNEWHFLPKEYIAIFDKHGYSDLDKVIVHNQASRKLKFNNRK
tara:strand:+ start:899 stop:1249 length:351 start_codon:yes stop_codon:yes gene_type:complete